jgi:predicted Zn-dependent protease
MPRHRHDLSWLCDIEMIGTDLEWRSSVASPTMKIARMTVAGN